MERHPPCRENSSLTQSPCFRGPGIAWQCKAPLALWGLQRRVLHVNNIFHHCSTHCEERLLNFCQLTCSHVSITQVTPEASLDAQWLCMIHTLCTMWEMALGTCLQVPVTMFKVLIERFQTNKDYISQLNTSYNSYIKRNNIMKK
jgi:hypothetical protein